MESGEAYIVGRQEFWFESPCKTSRATAKYSAKWHEQERFELKGSEVRGPKGVGLDLDTFIQPPKSMPLVLMVSVCYFNGRTSTG
jgi:hypothetical protein